MLRFGLTTTLLGDGYFGYDGGNGLSRGNWWWYPEYDAPLGYPKGPARRRPDGLWERPFQGGLVLVNGSVYDVLVTLPRKSRDVSSGRVGTRFMIPSFDGRIFVPSAAPVTPGPPARPHLTRTPPKTPQALRIAPDLFLARSPGGLELRFRRTGEITHILLNGRRVMTGGRPVIAAPPWRLYQAESVGEPRISATADSATLVFGGRLRLGAKRIEYVETVTVKNGNRFTLRYDFKVRNDLDIRLWRHYFAFPVAKFAGGVAEAGGKRITLPAALGRATLLPDARRVTVSNSRVRITIDSSVPLGLSDHRKWERPEYLLAGYPLSGRVTAGRKLAVEMRVRVQARAPDRRSGAAE